MTSASEHAFKPYTRDELAMSIINADTVVSNIMKRYLQRSRSGGMPKDLSDKIQAAVNDAARLGLFSYGIAVAIRDKS